MYRRTPQYAGWPETSLSWILTAWKVPASISETLRPFTGGQDAYSVKFITPKDRQEALASGIARLKAQVNRTKAIFAKRVHKIGVFRGDAAGDHAMPVRRLS